MSDQDPKIDALREQLLTAAARAAARAETASDNSLAGAASAARDLTFAYLALTTGQLPTGTVSFDKP